MPQPTDKQLLALEKAMDHVQQQYLENGKDPMYSVRAEVFSTGQDYREVFIADTNDKRKLDISKPSNHLSKFGLREWTDIISDGTGEADLTIGGGYPKIEAFKKGPATETTAHTYQRKDLAWPFSNDIRWQTDIHKKIYDSDRKPLIEMDLKCTTEQKQNMRGMTVPVLDKCKGTYTTKDGRHGKYESGNADHQVYYRKFTEDGKKPVEIMARLSEDKKDNKDVAHAWYWKGLFD